MRFHRPIRRFATVLLVAVALLPASVSAQRAASAETPAGKLHLPAETHEGLRLIFSGEPARAVEIAHRIQQVQPEHPAGYLLEANALWWRFYCEACEIKWNLIDAWKRGKIKEDERYLAMADRAIQLAEASIRKKDSAEMRVYAGMGWALRARLHGLRDERIATARTGVKAREHFLRAAELDPAMGDAQTGIGLYNYYADALSPFIKFLRFFLGIPGGNKKEGLRQLEVAMGSAELTRQEARFYAAKCLRNYDQRYEQAITLLAPLIEEYPQNPVFHLLLGDYYAKLRRKVQAREHYEAARKAATGDSACARRVRQLVEQGLALLR